MKNIFFISLLLLTMFSCTDKKGERTNSNSESLQKNEITVYKNPNCGCCTKWVEHMRANGFKLTEKPVDNLDEIKDSLGVPEDKRSCHTAVLKGYVFEGHIPAASIKKFLNDPAGQIGLAVPDMPTGSPGMESGNHKEKFKVYSFNGGGQSKFFEQY